MLKMCDKTFILTDKVEFVPDEEDGKWIMV